MKSGSISAFWVQFLASLRDYQNNYQENDGFHTITVPPPVNQETVDVPIENPKASR